MRATNIDWTGQLSKAGKAGKRKASKTRSGAGDDGYNRYAILTGRPGGVVYGLVVFGLLFVDWRVAAIVMVCCLRRLTISK